MSELALRLIEDNKMTHATRLDLGNCSLKTIPAQIEDLIWLEELILSGSWLEYNHIKNKLHSRNTTNRKGHNRIRSIKRLGKLVKLKKLIIGNPWVKIPWTLENTSTLKCLLELEHLEIKNSPISDLSSLKDLKNLKILAINGTSVDDLSPISSLTNLEILICSYTKIKDLSSLSNFQKLRVFDGSSNEINNLSPLSELKNLQYINISNTQVSSILSLENLQKIRYLKCSYTSIQDLSPVLHLLKTEMKFVFDFFEEDNSANFYNCPLTTPPPKVVAQGNAAILRYFEEREKAGTEEIYEAKLLLIGEGGAGKTSLCRKLFDPNAELPKEKDSTRGIDIQPLYFDLPNGKKFRLNVWDFAGQGKYQSAHTFFYTHRSLYVLVDDTRTLDENEAYRTFYNYWLETTELFGGQSPLLVLHNQKADRSRAGFNLGSFQERFPFVKELFRINLGADNTDPIEDLRKQIERWAAKLPHIGDQVPKTWVAVREDLEEERQQRPFISDERYRDICAAHGIDDDAKQSDLSRYFHDLGVFLHFQENPLLRRDVFLQNQWVTDAVYKILDDTEVAGQQRGRFDKNDLARLWNEGLYAKRRDELLALMLQFELCYQVQDTETYVCPQLLPGDVLAYDLGTNHPLQLRYEYGFMPKGLLYRLIVRLHRHIANGQSAVWNSGAVLERAGAKADLIEALDRRSISVRAVGARAKELLTIIHEEVEKLHATYGVRLRVDVKIPCNCRECVQSRMPHFYIKENLEKRLSRNVLGVECEHSYEKVDVRGLLDGVLINGFTEEKSTNMKKIFISYSHKDESLKDELDSHLSALKRGKHIDAWHDRKILAGTEWDDQIKEELEGADIVLLLVSANFLASEYIWKEEITRAMERQANGQTKVIPIFLKPCDFSDMPFAKLQGLPRDARPVTAHANQDEALMQIAKGIRALIEAK